MRVDSETDDQKISMWRVSLTGIQKIMYKLEQIRKASLKACIFFTTEFLDID